MPSARELQHRLYKTMGMATSRLTWLLFPANADNSSVVANCDFDNDGDNDLFVGSLSVPAVVRSYA